MGTQNLCENSAMDRHRFNTIGTRSLFHNISRNEEQRRQIFHHLISSYQWNDAIAFLSADNNEPPLASIRDDAYGDLPLHMALKRGAPEHFILPIIDNYEEAVSKTGSNDASLPLHLAIIHNSTSRVNRKILRRFPEALDMKDSDGDTPRNCMRKGIDATVRDALIKPSYYWTTLFAEFRSQDSSRFFNRNDNITKEGEQISILQKKVSSAEAKLHEAKLNEDIM